MKQFTIFLLFVITAMLASASFYLIYADKPGWGWFLALDFFSLLCLATVAKEEEIPEAEEYDEED